jgi:hypothetical protein
MEDKSEITETTDSTPLPAPEKLSPSGMASMQGDARVNSDWVDKGMVDVPVSELPEPEGVSGPENFDHHISWEDAQAATKKLPEIQEQVHNGKTGDDFSASDQAKGLEYKDGDRRIFDLYYGSDPVKLDKDGSEYTIVSGRHRIFAAKEAGLETIPAWVTEKVKS